MPENIFDEKVATKYDYSNRLFFDRDRLSVTSLFLAALAEISLPWNLRLVQDV